MRSKTMPAMLELWTIQTLPAWATLRQSGVLRAGPEYATEGFDAAYQWMAAQMRNRLRARPLRGALPLWAWAQWRDAAAARPDLRSRGHLSTGARGVRLQFVLPPDQVLLSDFQLWHYVLNGYYLVRSRAEDAEFERKLAGAGLAGFAGAHLPNPSLRRAMEQSWTRIFELGGRRSRARRSIQGAFWELPLSAVRAVDEFVAR